MPSCVTQISLPYKWKNRFLPNNLFVGELVLAGKGDLQRMKYAIIIYKTDKIDIPVVETRL